MQAKEGKEVKTVVYPGIAHLQVPLGQGTSDLCGQNFKRHRSEPRLIIMWISDGKRRQVPSPSLTRYLWSFWLEFQRPYIRARCLIIWWIFYGKRRQERSFRVGNRERKGSQNTALLTQNRTFPSPSWTRYLWSMRSEFHILWSYRLLPVSMIGVNPLGKISLPYIFWSYRLLFSAMDTIQQRPRPELFYQRTNLGKIPSILTCWSGLTLVI